VKYVVLLVIALLMFYAPCELTRVIIERLPIEELKSGYTVIELGQGIIGTVPLEATRSVYQPWNFYVEIAFMWVCYITVLGIIWWVIKKQQLSF